MSILKVLGVERLTLCPKGAAVLRVKGFLVHRGCGPQLGLADVCFPRADREWHMKAVRARTNVVVVLVLLRLTSLGLAQVDHAIVGPLGVRETCRPWAHAPTMSGS